MEAGVVGSDQVTRLSVTEVAVEARFLRFPKRRRGDAFGVRALLGDGIMGAGKSDIVLVDCRDAVHNLLRSCMYESEDLVAPTSSLCCGDKVLDDGSCFSGVDIIVNTTKR